MERAEALPSALVRGCAVAVRTTFLPDGSHGSCSPPWGRQTNEACARAPGPSPCPVTLGRLPVSTSTTSPPSRRALVSVLAVGLLVLVALGVAQTGWGKGVLEDAHLRGGNAAGYTELSFPNPRRLSRNLATVRSVRFTVHNAEGAGRNYPWTATLRGAGTSRTLGRGTLPLAAGDRRTVSVAMPDVCASVTRRTRFQVVVSLATAKRETIAFYTACGAPRHG
jgi:hypothetical protein